MDAAAARGTSCWMEQPIIAAAAMRSSLSPLLPGCAARSSLVAAAATQKPVAEAVAAAAWREEQRRKDSRPFVIGKPFETVDSAAIWRGNRGCCRCPVDQPLGGATSRRCYPEAAWRGGWMQDIFGLLATSAQLRGNAQKGGVDRCTWEAARGHCCWPALLKQAAFPRGPLSCVKDKFPPSPSCLPVPWRLSPSSFVPAFSDSATVAAYVKLNMAVPERCRKS